MTLAGVANRIKRIEQVIKEYPKLDIEHVFYLMKKKSNIVNNKRASL